MSISSRVLYPIFFALLPQASASFQPNCTIPSETVNFVSSSNVRGTLDILWSCLLTIILCTWTVQHLNIPEESPESTTWAQVLKQILKTSWTNIKWNLVALISPEAAVGKAYQDLMMARRSVREMAELARIDDVPWTMVHAQHANLGGFKFKAQGCSWEVDSLVGSSISDTSFGRVYDVIRDMKTAAGGSVQIWNGDWIKRTESVDERGLGEGEREKDVQIGDPEKEAYRQPPITGPPNVDRTDSPSVRSFPERIEEESVTSTMPSQRDDGRHSIVTSHTERPRSSSTQRSTTFVYIFPNADQLRLMREANVIQRLPSISALEITSITRPEPLAKTITVFQAIWFTIQVITRTAKHLPISQLEIATLAYVACALLIYILNWSKPQGITTPTEVNYSHPINRGEFDILSIGFDRVRGTKAIKRLYPQPSWKDDGYMLFSPPNDLIFNEGPEWLKINNRVYFSYFNVALSLSGMVFGGIHLLAWDFVFPSYVEKVVWKVASCYIAGNVAIFPVAYVGGLVREYTSWKWGLLGMGILFNCGFTVAYLLAKLGLVVLMFRSLGHLPAGAFVGTWVEGIPHLS
jgi:hypothetical protein